MIVVRRDMQNQSTGLVSGDIPVGDETVSSFDPHITLTAGLWGMKAPPR